jgi:archaellum component FlaF (FlaF/FlaG flagellin family)
VIDCVVAPVDQRLPVVAEEVSVMLLPAQNDDGPLMTGVAGSGFAVTEKAADVAWQPFASVTVTVYEPAAETVIDCVVSPVDQRFPDVAEDVRVMLLPAQNDDGPLMTGVAGSGFAVTEKAADVAWQPFASVTVTVKEPAADTVIDCVVAPVDQRLPVVADEVRVMLLPAQNADGPLIVGVAGAGFAVTVNGADVAWQPLASVTDTVKVPAAETVIDCVVSPVDQRFPDVALEVSVMLFPVQNDDGPLIVGVAAADVAVTVNGAEVAVQPPAFVTVTVKVPAAETVIDWVVAPVDQTLPVVAEEVSVMLVPPQNEVGPVIVGVGGAGLAVTVKGAEVAEQPFAFVAVTVKVPLAATVIDCVVAPVDQTLPVAAEDVRVMLFPVQNVVGPLMVGVTAAGFTVTGTSFEIFAVPQLGVVVTTRK